ncbi:hypothetical protein HMPREF1589_03370 [Escherichia coli 113290]|nr:hypothetical protein HMPREF1589_03370 [Escherichia coli 113290]
MINNIHQINIKKNRKTYNSIQIIRIGFATRAFCPLFPRGLDAKIYAEICQPMKSVGS